jgi:hypothetical protein
VNEVEVVPFQTQLELEKAKEGVAARLSSRKYLLSLLDFELFTLEQMFKETEREQSAASAARTLEYAQQVLALMDATPKPQ